MLDLGVMDLMAFCNFHAACPQLCFSIFAALDDTLLIWLAHQIRQGKEGTDMEQHGPYTDIP